MNLLHLVDRDPFDVVSLTASGQRMQRTQSKKNPKKGAEQKLLSGSFPVRHGPSAACRDDLITAASAGLGATARHRRNGKAASVCMMIDSKKKNSCMSAEPFVISLQVQYW